MRKLKDKRGASYILTCVIILTAVALIFIALEYAHIYHIARTQKEETQLKLDSYITGVAVKNYNALKQGDVYGAKLDTKEICEGALTVLGFPPVQTLPYIEAGNEKFKYTMKQPHVSYLYQDMFGIFVTYEIVIPFEMFNRKIADISIPIEIVSLYTET
ncbi:MAG: hypothetical protein II861_00395, partial [Methanomicrobium sp.]|nr:hypothetical protein [Methanomicrobium sp.]